MLITKIPLISLQMHQEWASENINLFNYINNIKNEGILVLAEIVLNSDETAIPPSAPSFMNDSTYFQNECCVKLSREQPLPGVGFEDRRN